MKILRTITFWTVCTFAMACPASNFYFRTVTIRDGLADNYVRNIVRDHEGYIWISTINGLSRYDGMRFQNYTPMRFGAKANDVTSVSCTADSTTWMLCINELFTYDRNKGIWKKDGSERLKSLGIKGSMKTFYIDDKHNSWVETDYALYYYDYAQRNLSMIPNYNRLPIAHIISKNGTTIVVTTDYKIYNVSLSEKRLIPIGQAPITEYNRDRKVFLDSNMNLWVYNAHTMARSIWILSLKSNKWKHIPESQLTEDMVINDITEDYNGNIWVGTQNAGIRVFDYQGDELVKSDISNMHPYISNSSHITCLYLDKNNTMWVGSAKFGVAFTDMDYRSFDIIKTEKYEDVSALIQDQKGNLWIGFDGSGVIMKTPSGTTTHYSALRNQLPSNFVTSFARLGDGSIAVGTYGSGIAMFNGTKFTPPLFQ